MNKVLTKFELPEKYCEVTANSLTFKGEVPFEVWENIGSGLKKIGGSIQLWLGDWLNYGEKVYGEKYSQALEGTHYAYTTLREYASIAQRTENLRKNVDSHLQLPITHLNLIADLEPKQQEKWAKKAAENQMTVKELREAIKESRKTPTPKLPEGKYNVIYTDPPWEYSNSGFEMSAENKYPTMSIEEIKKIEVPNLSADNCIMFMWATNPLLKDAIELMNYWGFDYKTNFVWVKTRHTAGFYIFGQHELLLIGVRGSMLPQGDKPISVIRGENKIHSKKPLEVYETIELMFPNAKYLEMFARNEREKWTSWGNETQKYA